MATCEISGESKKLQVSILSDTDEEALKISHVK